MINQIKPQSNLGVAGVLNQNPNTVDVGNLIAMMDAVLQPLKEQYTARHQELSILANQILRLDPNWVANPKAQRLDHTIVNALERAGTGLSVDQLVEALNNESNPVEISAVVKMLESMLKRAKPVIARDVNNIVTLVQS